MNLHMSALTVVEEVKMLETVESFLANLTATKVTHSPVESDDMIRIEGRVTVSF